MAKFTGKKKKSTKRAVVINGITREEIRAHLVQRFPSLFEMEDAQGLIVDDQDESVTYRLKESWKGASLTYLPKHAQKIMREKIGAMLQLSKEIDAVVDTAAKIADEEYDRLDREEGERDAAEEAARPTCESCGQKLPKYSGRKQKGPRR